MAEIRLTHNPLAPENIKVLMDKIGVQWVSRIMEYFEISGPEDEKWPPTQNPQKAAILERIRKLGLNVKDRDLNRYFDENKKPLIDTGILMNSWTHRTIINENMVTLEVGTNIEYAEKHHHGLIERININSTMKQAIRRLIDYERLRFLRQFLDKKYYDVHIRRRTLIKFDDRMREALNILFEEFFKEMNSRKG